MLLLNASFGIFFLSFRFVFPCLNWSEVSPNEELISVSIDQFYLGISLTVETMEQS